MKQSVIDLQEIEQGVIQLTMQDRIHKNMFSEDLIVGLQQSFDLVQADQNCKVVILTGYDSYFATGGTKEGLLNLYEGKFQFTETNVYSLALECKIPVIAAMQGHGIGGGLVMGLFSDFVILSRESIYTANFMKYGFTPGMGATCILPEKLGFSLAEELLITANNYRGAELEKRGIAFPVLPRNDVLSSAYRLASQIAEKPRLSLISLKDHMVAPLRSKLNKVVEEEVAMHEKTFHQAEVKARINELFGEQ